MRIPSFNEVCDNHDRLEVVDALYRLAAGIDENSAALLDSAFTANAVVDFGPAARTMGIDFPLLTGRDAIVSALTASVGLLDTTHIVANPRAVIGGETARLNALVEAAHLPPNDHSRRCVMKNRYAAELERDRDAWRIARLIVHCAWYEGDPKILLGQ